MTPLLLFCFDIRTTVVATAIIEILGSLWVTLQARHTIDRPCPRILLPMGILGMVAGSFALVKMDSDLLKRIFGIVTVVFALRIMLALPWIFCGWFPIHLLNVTWQVLEISVVMFPASLLGAYFGKRSHARVSQEGLGFAVALSALSCVLQGAFSPGSLTISVDMGF